MTAKDGYARLEQQIDICADLHDDLSWTNAEVLETLIDIGLAWDAPDRENGCAWIPGVSTEWRGCRCGFATTSQVEATGHTNRENGSER